MVWQFQGEICSQHHHKEFIEDQGLINEKTFKEHNDCKGWKKSGHKNS
jgi:hypothetical protein